MSALTAINYLRKKEWSMGNGQCPECEGVPESWHGHPCYPKAESIGHEQGCSLANTLKELGESPIFLGDYKNDAIYEGYITDNGFYAMRIKGE